MILPVIRRVLVLSLSMLVQFQLVWGDNKQIICSSPYIIALVDSLVGSEISTTLIIDETSDPYHYQGLDDEQIPVLENSKLIIVHKHQKALIRAIKKLKIKQLSLIILDHKPLVVPLNYMRTAQQLKKVLSKKYPELNVYMDERIGELEEGLALLNNQYLAKGRDLNFADVNCVVAKRQVDFANWLGVAVIATFTNENMMSEKEKNTIINLASQKKCWLVISNKHGGFNKIGQAISDAIDGEVIILSDSPVSNEMIDIPSWQVLLDENVSRIADAIVWH